MTGAFVGTGMLLRFALRRDRVILPAWTAFFLAYTVGGTAAAAALYPDLASRAEAAATVNNMPALVAMYGRIWDPTSPGAVAMMKPIGFGGVFAALFGILLVTRHTRAEEESGRLELIAAQPVGRLAPLASALTLVAGTMTIIALLNGLGITATGLPAAGAWAFALSVSLTGMYFAGIAAVAVQLTQSARTANVLALCELALAFVLRGTADAAGDASAAAWWTWLSPIGWQDQVRAFEGDSFALLPAAPTLTGLAWVVVCAALVISEFGTMLSWPSAVMDSSPFTHVPHMPAAPMAWVPTLLLLAVATVFAGIAFEGYQRRDLATP